MTGLLTRTGVRTEGKHPQWWMSAPVIATFALLVLMFLHVALEGVLPNKIFVLLLFVVVATTARWMVKSPTRLAFGAVELAMALYLVWNVFSMLAPHKYGPDDPLGGENISVPRLIMTGTAIPFVMYFVGRHTFDRIVTVRRLLWLILTMAAYAAVTSILPVTGPKSLVWPRFIVDGSLPADKTWSGRAIGVFNQPVVNGLTLALGVAAAMLLMAQRDEPPWRKWLAFAITIACGYSIYLTHTRAAWLSGVVVLVVGALLASGYRRGFVVGLGLVSAVVAANWSVFSSSDRAAGGVGSQEEVNDRLNMIQTALWAFQEKPISGWGIGRFVIVNTYHHQQWATDVPWTRGYGVSSHENELGILAELGLIGLVLWVAVLMLIAYRLWDAYRTLPNDQLWGRPLAVIAITAFAVLFCTGVTVDLRIFDFPSAVVFLLAGAATGWSDRYKQRRAAGGDVFTTRPGFTYFRVMPSAVDRTLLN